MDTCQWIMIKPSDKMALCGWYVENEKDKQGRPYAHYPICNCKDCPIKRKSK